MAGTGPRFDALQRVAADNGVELLGEVHDVPRLLAHSDVFIFTGRPPEGMPGVLIEAGMAGLPVVTTDVPGARDVVRDGETGFVVPIDDFDALVRATSTLVEDDTLRSSYGRAGRAYCIATFSIDRELSAWRELLSDVMEEQCESST
jgi:glycosyltransferase involved in cell wall biosynthesis